MHVSDVIVGVVGVSSDYSYSFVPVMGSDRTVQYGRSGRASHTRAYQRSHYGVLCKTTGTLIKNIFLEILLMLVEPMTKSIDSAMKLPVTEKNASAIAWDVTSWSTLRSFISITGCIVTRFSFSK